MSYNSLFIYEIDVNVRVLVTKSADLNQFGKQVPGTLEQLIDCFSLRKKGYENEIDWYFALCAPDIPSIKTIKSLKEALRKKRYENKTQNQQTSSNQIHLLSRVIMRKAHTDPRNVFVPKFAQTRSSFSYPFLRRGVFGF